MVEFKPSGSGRKSPQDWSGATPAVTTAAFIGGTVTPRLLDLSREGGDIAPASSGAGEDAASLLGAAILDRTHPRKPHSKHHSKHHSALSRAIF